MLCKTTLDVWDRVGTEQAGDVLAYMLSVTDDFDEFFDDQNIDAVYNQYWLGEAYGWLCNTSFGISFDTDAKECWEFCLGYRDLFIAVKEQNEELSTTIKEMRSEYADKHSSEFSLIDDLYVEVSTFAEFALRPSGSLMNYNSEFGEYQTSTSKFLKSADIY